VVIVLFFALVIVTRFKDLPWIFVGELVASGLILSRALRRDARRYHRAGPAAVGVFMILWGLTDLSAVLASVHVVAPHAVVLLVAGVSLLGGLVWGVVSQRQLRAPGSPG
jgi:predicted benzoate:H+ symporter BenE